MLDGRELDSSLIPKWQSQCSYVPQSINLLNNDLISNVAYGEEYNIDEDKVWESLVAAQLEDLIKTLPDGLKTKVGDNGIRLSGATTKNCYSKSFYRDTKLLILDEATSALDNKTEAKLIKALLKINKKLTIIFIAHRLSTVRSCDCIYEFEKGEIKAYGIFKDLKNKSQTFAEMTKIADKEI